MHLFRFKRCKWGATNMLVRVTLDIKFTYVNLRDAPFVTHPTFTFHAEARENPAQLGLRGDESGK